MFKRIAHTAFTVANMPVSLHFYCDQLGFQRWFQLKKPDGTPWIEYLRISQDQFLELFYGDAMNAASSSVGFHHLCLAVDDIYETVSALEQAGVSLDKQPKQGLDLNWQCWISDPDGNKIELMQMHPDSPQNQPSTF